MKSDTPSTAVNRLRSPLLVCLALLGLTATASAQHYTITSNWFVDNGAAGTHIATGDNNRGIAADANANLVYVCNKGTPAIDVLDGNTGTYLGSASMTGVNGGAFLLDQVAVADDGLLYAGNLGSPLPSSIFRLYQWNGYSNAPTAVYAADPTGGTLGARRMGDNMAIQGTGTNTVILVPVENGTTPTTNVVLFSTVNGTTFTSTLLNIAGMPAPGTPTAGPVAAICFYTNNTFLFKPVGTSLYVVQFPTNFASLTSPVQATVIATNTTFTSDSRFVLNYVPAANLLGAIGAIQMSAPSVDPVNLYFANPIGTASSSVGNASVSHTNLNGNAVGGIALGGLGKTNLLFTLDCNNGVRGYTVTFVPAATAPVISGSLTGGTVYTNIGSYAFNVSATGTAPLVYYWQSNNISNQATATTVAITTNTAAFTLTPLTTNKSGWYDVIVSNSAGISNTAPVLLTVIAPLTSPFVTELWSLPADNSAPYLDIAGNTRGLAFDPITTNVVVAEHAAANIYALNGLTGASNFVVTTPSTGLPLGSIFPVGQVGVADDGVMYVCNVSSYQTGQTGGDDFSVTRFSSVTDPNGPNPYTLFPSWTGDPGNAIVPASGGTYSGGDRWGDSFAVRGAGANTQILLGTYQFIGGNAFGTGPGTNVAILTTQDGMTFTATTLIISDPTQSSNTPPSGFAYLGVAWGASNTFWTKSPGYNLRQIQYDITNGTGTVIQSFSTTAGQGSLNNLDGIGLDNDNNILAGVLTSDSPNDLELFQIPSAGFPPQPYYQDFFKAFNPNGNGNAATAIKFPYIFSLDANNGIIGLKYSVPLLPFHVVPAAVNGKVVLTWQTVIGRTYQLQSTPVMVGPPATNVWTNIGSPVTAAASGSQSFTNNSPTGTQLYYQVVAH